ncbi:MAG: hypothetical protein WA945_07755 [Arcobacteraceae bacterium]
MIATKTLQWLLEVWESFGYEAFKLEIKELGLLNKGFSVTEIRQTILESSEIMEGYIKVSAFEVKEIPYNSYNKH